MRLHFIKYFTLLFLLIGCQPKTADRTDGNHLIIYTSIYPIQYITEQIVGQTAEVKSVFPPGVDAHSYEPPTRKIIDIAKSDAFFYLGEHMEGFSDIIADALKFENVKFLAIGKYQEIFLKDKNDSELDPHLWLDPLRMIDMAEIICAQLIQISPNQEELFNKNFQSLKSKLLELDEIYLQKLDTKKDKTIIVSYGSYEYLNDRYNIQQIPINGVSEGYEPSQKELIELVNMAKKKDIQYVIFEQNNIDRISKIIQDHLNAEALYLHNLEVLTDLDIKNNEDYLSIMEKNLKTLDEALD